MDDDGAEGTTKEHLMDVGTVTTGGWREKRVE